MSRYFLWHMIFVLLLSCVGCTGNSITGEEPPDIKLAREGFYNESRAQFAEGVQEYINEVPPDAVQLLPDVTVGELEKAELGEYLSVWELEKGEEMWQVQLVPEKHVTEQIISKSTYMFSIVVEGRMVADYTATIEEGDIRGSSCSLINRMRWAHDVAKANEVDIQQCYLVAAPGGSMFLFFVDNGTEICSGELKKYLTDLAMSEEKVEAFKRRVTAFNQLQEPVPEHVPVKPGEFKPAGNTPPFF